MAEIDAGTGGYQPSPSFESMRTGLTSGTLRLTVAKEGASVRGLYRVIPGAYTMELILRFILLPAIYLASAAVAFLGIAWLSTNPFGLSGVNFLLVLLAMFCLIGLVTFVVFLPPLGLLHLLQSFRENRLTRQVSRDPRAYAAAMRHGIVRVEPTYQRRGKTD